MAFQWLAVVVVTAVLALGAGCTMRQVTMTERSATEQELLVRALERALARLDTTRLQGRRVALELYAWTKDQAFAREFVAAQLAARGANMVGAGAEADLHLEVFASILGLDRGETLLGLPALQVPVVSVPIPEIALFKWVRNRGRAEVQVYLYDPRSGEFRTRLFDGVGRSKYDEFTVLVFVSFTVSDLDKRSEAPSAPGVAGRPTGSDDRLDRSSPWPTSVWH
jgi:hypothetical protein